MLQTLSLVNAKIEGDLICRGCRSGDKKSEVTSECNGLILERARITKTLILNSGFRIIEKLILIYAKVGILCDSKDAWPEKGNLDLNGFEYDAIHSLSDAKSRLEWLGLMNKFVLGAYEQLAAVFRKMGKEDEVWKIQIGKIKAGRKALKTLRRNHLQCFHKVPLRLKMRCRRYLLKLILSAFFCFTNILHKIFLGWTIGYGHRPCRVLCWIAGFVVIGWSLYCIGNSNGLMVITHTSTAPPDSQTFSPFIYSLDTFVPLVNLHQHEYWLPDSTKPWGWWLRIWLWFEIVAGWFLSTIGLASVTGLIKK